MLYLVTGKCAVLNDYYENNYVIRSTLYFGDFWEVVTIAKRIFNEILFVEIIDDDD